MMPDKGNFGAVLQPVAGSLGNRGLRSHTELDGHGAYVPVPFTKSKRAQSTTDDETWVDGKVNPTLSLFDQGDTRATTVAVAFKPGQSAEARTIGAQVGVACTLEAGGGGNNKQAVAFKRNGAKARSDAIFRDVTPTLGCAGGNAMPSIQQAMTVRRLTPRECERLQGFLDDYTAIPWRNKPAEECPDGPRYKALGNSMAVNCMAWIGQRIDGLQP